MPSVYDLKPAFQNLLRPLVRALARAGVSANQVTLLAALLSCVAGAALWLRPSARWSLLLIPVVLFLRMALNAIDGMLAREHDMQTPLGALLNELGDVFADAALYLPFVAIAGVPALWVVLLVVLALISEMTGVVAVQIGASRRYDGPMGKSDRAMLFGAIALLAGLGVALQPWLEYVLIAALGLSLLTIVNRARGALREVGAP